MRGGRKEKVEGRMRRKLEREKPFVQRSHYANPLCAPTCIAGMLRNQVKLLLFSDSQLTFEKR